MDRFYEYLLMERRPENRALYRLVGLLIPFAAAFYSVAVATAGYARISTGRGFNRTALELRGFDAILYVACILSGSVAIHCFCFWEESLHPYAKFVPPILVSSLLVFCGACGWLLYRQFATFV